MASTTAKKAICTFVHEWKQIAPQRVPFLVRNTASMLGFLEFITEDELQERVGGFAREIYTYKDYRLQITKGLARACSREEEIHMLPPKREAVFIHGTLRYARIHGGVGKN